MIEWRAVAEFPAYEVSSAGDLRRADDHVHLLARPDNTGYRRVTFSVPGLKRYRYVHRLVAAAFLGAPVGGEIVCHRNGDRLDNRFANLRHGTHQTNRLDAVEHGTAANSRPRFDREQRRALTTAATHLSTAAMRAQFGISPTYARLVRHKLQGA